MKLSSNTLLSLKQSDSLPSKLKSFSNWLGLLRHLRLGLLAPELRYSSSMNSSWWSSSSRLYLTRTLTGVLGRSRQSELSPLIGQQINILAAANMAPLITYSNSQHSRYIITESLILKFVSSNLMSSKLNLLLCALLIVCYRAQAQYLVFPRGSVSNEIVPANKIKVHISPLGMKPKTGILHGGLKLAEPISACSDVQSVDVSNEQDTFMIADDSKCLESVKARNLASSGAYIGIIKRNINNTLHDREVDIVHIPILEVEPNHYEAIVDYMNKHPNQTIAVQADFSQDREKHKRINMQLWFSPTETKAYTYIEEMTSFILKQEDKIQFRPRFVLHSQTAQKQYVGCFSRGRFCPPELEFEGKPNGVNVVGESLRQLIISQIRISEWFKYVNQFHQKCVKNQLQTIWDDQNTVLCSENVMRSQGINAEAVFTAYNTSFLGSRPEVDGNIYLEQERQDYIAEKITHYPVVLINGKGYALNTNINTMKLKICSMINPDPYKQTAECQKLTKPPLFTTGEILLGIGILMILMVGVMFAYKFMIHRKMKKEMRGQVDKTLSQYYRYMETLQEPDASTGKVPLMEQKIESNQIGSVELTDIKDPKA